MSAILPPFMLEPQKSKEEALYVNWLRAKVEKSLTEAHLAIPHDEVEARMKARFSSLRKATCTTLKP